MHANDTNNTNHPHSFSPLIRGRGRGGRLRGKWVAIGGNRWISNAVAEKVQRITRQVIKSGGKIITGGAEGVDHAVLRACLKYELPKDKLKVYLPYTIQKQYEHYRKLEGKVKAEKLLETLLKIKDKYPRAIQENKRIFKNYRKAADFRNSLIENKAQFAIIFKPQGSKGSLDALKKFKTKRKPYMIV